MQTMTRVQDGNGQTGTVTDTGCGGQVVWVTWEDGTVTMVERTEDGMGWWDPESGEPVV